MGSDSSQRYHTQRSLVDPRDNENSEGNSFGRYLSTDSANTYIRSALLSAPSAQDAQVAGIGTTKTGYLIKCHLYHDNYGSDHRATYSEWNLQARYKLVTKARKAFDRAEWNKIGEEVLRQIGPWKEIKTRPALDGMVQKLIEATTAAVNRYTPDVRPTPYSKRWFTPDLKVQQTKANQLRRKWQESCAQLGREAHECFCSFRLQPRCTQSRGY
ncbi:hypothetical protein AAEP93_009100 [Penicillium crustosum]